jgi:hypothetical protein
MIQTEGTFLIKDFLPSGGPSFSSANVSCVSLWAAAPDASGVKTPDQAILYVGIEVPTSKAIVSGQRQRKPDCTGAGHSSLKKSFRESFLDR